MTQDERKGIVYAGVAYSLWGILALFWKQLNHISAGEILANRIFWSFWFMLLVLIIGRQLPSLFANLKQIRRHPKTFIALGVASILISINWFLFIWAVNMNMLVETSLGYYINPLVSVLLGVIVLKEKLSAIQVASFFLALGGVLIMTITYGQFPWVSFGLALSFGVYGLVKKLIKVDSSIGLVLETLVIMPVAFIYLMIQMFDGTGSLFSGSLVTDGLLMVSGVVTAVPLLYFAKGVQKIPLYLMGFMQYIAPTLMLFLGVFLYGEPFGTVRIIAFSFIWTALALFTLSTVNWPSRKKNKQLGKMG
ncbi:EamA family transporter RarD [Lederbergia lenta]|uniref:RarD protein n=1 Tax=Lederbergia lenta TaxID=1467 RepID=A0A2X4VVT8_LEDLE|nr:EamA family transporter RarD [Lederbergia lenta]MEC2325513.1 EamA family transporter RarD [Lederbergia lenta]SQI54931.1 RarD protein [Lederbergia lenta]